MEEAIARIVTELQDIRHFHNSTNSEVPHISDSSLSDLQTLLDNILSADDSAPMDCLYEELSSKSLSPSDLVFSIASAMDSGPTHLSLFASNVYLSLLLSPNSPVFTLFTPVAFLSLLRSIRRSIKNRPTDQPAPLESSQGHHVAAKRKKSRGARGSGSKNGARSSYNEDCERDESEFDVRVLFSVLERLQLVMGLIHLDRFPDSLKSLVQTVAEIPEITFEL